MMTRVLGVIALLGGLTFTQLTERASGGEWYGYGVAPVAYSVGSPYGYYYYAGYYPYQMVSYPLGLYGYYFPYRYHYAAYPYGYYGNYVTYPIAYPAAYVATYPTAVAAAVVPAAVAPTAQIGGYQVPAGYKLVPADAEVGPGKEVRPSDPAALNGTDLISPRSASAYSENVLPPITVEKSN